MLDTNPFPQALRELDYAYRQGQMVFCGIATLDTAIAFGQWLSQFPHTWRSALADEYKVGTLGIRVPF